MKLPRDCSAKDLIRALCKYGYVVVRQSGSHIRMRTQDTDEHHVTIPNHNPIKVGTLQAILRDIAAHHELTIEQLLIALEL